jgi:hypothetical protein
VNEGISKALARMVWDRNEFTAAQHGGNAGRHLRFFSSTALCPELTFALQQPAVRVHGFALKARKEKKKRKPRRGWSSPKNVDT